MEPIAAGERPLAIRDVKLIVYEDTLVSVPGTVATVVLLSGCAVIDTGNNAKAYNWVAVPLLTSDDGTLLKGGDNIGGTIAADDPVNGGPAHFSFADTFLVGYRFDHGHIGHMMQFSRLSISACLPNGGACSAAVLLPLTTVPACVADGLVVAPPGCPYPAASGRKPALGSNPRAPARQP